MNNTVLTKSYPHFPFDKREILRFAGVKGATPEILNLLEECLEEVKEKFTYKVCYIKCDVELCNTFLDFGFFKTSSKNLQSHLKNCDSAIIFAATVGIGIDKLIAKYNKTSPSKALILSAIGSERIEGLCNIFCDSVKENNLKQTPRFSAGYGDFPLDYQKDFFRILGCHTKIGLTLNDSLIMSPTKSVTAVIGLKSKD